MSYPPPPCAFYAAYHLPRLYRYQVAEPGLRVMWNRYTGRDGSATIGLAVTVGRYAYCIKWAEAERRGVTIATIINEALQAAKDKGEQS